jgi:hydroxymethylpyrimidine/phosphomethylpyrimidine kinase
VLIIASTDSSGGAGLVRDVQVLAEFGVDTRCVVTAVTAQTDSQVTAIHCLPPQLVRQQMEAALQAGGVAAIKIGMLGTQAIIEMVAQALPSRARVPIVLDPVLASSSGGSLLEERGIRVLREQLLPRVTLITPNLPEAAVLLDEAAAADESIMIDQARRLLRLGPQAVLIKGGHAAGEESVDVLITASSPPLRMGAARVNTTLRGTGCALSSAIAASLAMKITLAAACERAKGYVLGELRDQVACTRVC